MIKIAQLHGRMRQVIHICSALIAIVAAGCSATHYPDAMLEKGAVDWNYQSRTVPPEQGHVPSISGSIVVEDIKSQPPSGSASAIAVLSLFPVLSFATLASPSPSYINVNHADSGGIRRWEIAEILAEEIRKSGIARDVVLAKEKAVGDYAVRGSANFEEDHYNHYSGFGGIAYSLGLLPVFTLPMWSIDMSCDAHLEVVSRRTGARILSKDYRSKTSFFVGAVYSGDERIWAAYGKEVFPAVVEQFIADLKTLPLSAWKK